MVVKLGDQAAAYGARSELALFHHIDSRSFAVKRGEIADRILLDLACRLLGKLYLKRYGVAIGILAMHQLPYLAPVY